jgi:hypothetical protein
MQAVSAAQSFRCSSAHFDNTFSCVHLQGVIVSCG